MKLKGIEKIAKKIAKKYGTEDCIRLEKLDSKFVRVYTEMPSYEGGDEFTAAVQKELFYHVENEGGACYLVDTTTEQ